MGTHCCSPIQVLHLHHERSNRHLNLGQIRTVDMKIEKEVVTSNIILINLG